AVVEREGDHAVDVGRRDPGVVERGLHALGGELELAASGVLRELGLADARDRGGPGASGRHADLRTSDGAGGRPGPPCLRAGGRKTGTALPPRVGAKSTSTGRPCRTSPGAAPTTFETRRIPSSSSTSATTGGSAKPTGAGWRGTIQL